MLTEVSAHTAAPAPAPPTAPADAAPARSAWWVRLLARVPWAVGYGFATVLGWLAFRVFPYRERLVRENLTRAFPHLDEPELRAVMRGYYLGFAQMLVEVIKGAGLPGEEIPRVTRFPVFFISMRRTGRGYYEMRIEPLAEAGEVLSTGALTERYARLVEQQIHDAPSDWPWSHKRWKLRPSVYQSRARQES